MKPISRALLAAAAVLALAAPATAEQVIVSKSHPPAPPLENVLIKPSLAHFKGNSGGHPSHSLPGDAGPVSPLAEYATMVGPLPPHGLSGIAAKVAAVKARAAAAAAQAPIGKAPAADLAVAGSCAGPASVGVTPGDPTLAVGATRVVAVSNGQVKVTDKNCNVIYTASLQQQIASTCDLAFDPQSVFNPNYQRFGVLSDCTQGANTYLVFQFSKKEAVGGVGDWCTYFTYLVDANGNPTPFEDFPKAAKVKVTTGGQRDFFDIGFDEYVSNSAETGADFRGADAFVMHWPDTSTSCPAFSALGLTFYSNLVDGSGNQVFSPNPVDYSDDPTPGHILAARVSQIGGTVTSGVVWKLVGDATGAPALTRMGGIVFGQSCVAPPSAKQSGSTITLDESDCRFYGVAGGLSPALGKEVATIALSSSGSGFGAGSVAVYEELDLVNRVTVESGAVIDAGDYLYNPSFSNDRAALAGTGGDHWFIQANRSGTGSYPAIVAFSKTGSGAWGPETRVVGGSGPYFDFTGCGGGTNRWGDYSGLKADPSVPKVWGLNMKGVPGACSGGAPWKTTLFSLTP